VVYARLIISRDYKIYKVRVVAPGPPRRIWLSVYQSKLLCVSELKEVGLITPVHAEEIMIDGFDLRDGLFVLEVDKEADFLEAQGFAEQEGVKQRKIPGKQAAWAKPISSRKRAKGSVANGDRNVCP
jgi:hypothetical protein